MSDRVDPDVPGPGDADAALVAEYVLRLLGPEEEAQARARVDADPGFAALVAEWRESFAQWDAEVAPVAPSPGLRGAVERRLFGSGPSMLQRLWRSAGLWRGIAAVATLAAGVLAVVDFAPRAPQPPGADVARLISALATVEGAAEAEFLALVEPQAAVLNLNRVAGQPGSGRDFELWFIEEGESPVSLGVLPDGPVARVPLGRELAERIAAGGALAVSDEPQGGSTTGAPSGDVLAVGELLPL